MPETVNTDFDVIVIGAGAVGENAADLAGRTGLSVAIVESELVGGECSYWACMPSKALLRPGEVIDIVNRTPGVNPTTLDLEAALKRRNSLAGHWDDAGQVKWLDSVGVSLLRGFGRLAGPRRVEVETDQGTTLYEASSAVVVATGTRAAVPPIPGLRDIRTWDNRDITSAQELPGRLILLGGGVVGVEMAQAWKSLGVSDVTVVEMADRLLPREEPFVGEVLAESLREMGIVVLTSTKLTAVARETADSPVTATVEGPDGTMELEGDEIVVAVGRRPATDDLGLETVGLEPGKYLDVDERMVVGNVDGDWLYAIGDVNGRALFTHTGKYQARIAGAHIAGNTETRATTDTSATPRVIFTYPQVAAVGSTEADARDGGLDVEVVEYDTGSVAAAATLGRGYGGPAKLVIEAGTRRLVGATFVGPNVGELLHAATVAIVGEVTIDQLWHAIPSYPTVSEVWLRLLETYRDTYDHTFV